MQVAFRGVAQVVERLVRDQEAAGSSPVTPTNRRRFILRLFLFVYFSKLSEQGERNKKPPALRVEGEKLKLQEAKPPW